MQKLDTDVFFNMKIDWCVHQNNMCTCVRRVEACLHINMYNQYESLTTCIVMACVCYEETRQRYESMWYWDTLFTTLWWYAKAKYVRNPARRRWCTMLTCACLVNEKHDYAIEHVHVLLMPQMKSDLVRWHSECINLRTIFIAHKFEIKWAQWCIAVNKHMSLCNVARSLWSRSYSTRWNWMYLPAMLNSNGIRIRDETRTMIWLIEWNTHMCKFVHTKQDFATSWYWMLCV